MPFAVLAVVQAGLVVAIMVAVVIMVVCMGKDMVAAVVAASSHPLRVLMVNATCVVAMDIVHMIVICAALEDVRRPLVVSLWQPLLFTHHHQLQTLKQVTRLQKTERGSSHHNLGDYVWPRLDQTVSGMLVAR